MLQPSRLRPPRSGTQTQKPTPLAVKSFVAPTVGLVTNATMPVGTGALVLENFWPSPTGIEPRGGCVWVGSIAGEGVTLFEHRASGTFFVATQTQIYPFSATSSGGALVADVSGLTSGAWSSYEMQNSGGSFLLCANGADPMQRYDGASWIAVTGTGTGAITGVTTSDVTFIWGHRSRVFMIQRQSMSAWYLSTNAIAGAATELPLAGVFRSGGSLMMGGTWSSDSGSGMDDRCFFVTDAGEVAIFEGSNPGDTTNWSLVGVYDVGVPLGAKGVVYVGGDVLFMTRQGVIPLSAVVGKDPTQLAATAVSRAIQPDIARSIANAPGDWRLGKWPGIGMLFALPLGDTPEAPEIFAANMESVAWMTITGWAASDMASLGSWLYFCTRSGLVMRAWVGGQDDGAPFTCRAMLAFDSLTDLASRKSVSVIQSVWKARGQISYGMAAARDYARTWGPPPWVAAGTDADDSSLWDIATWDLSPWASDPSSYSVVSGWRGITGLGFAFAPTVQLVCNSPGKVSAQMQRIDLGYVQAGAVT